MKITFSYQIVRFLYSYVKLSKYLGVSYGNVFNLSLERFSYNNVLNLLRESQRF